MQFIGYGPTVCSSSPFAVGDASAEERVDEVGDDVGGLLLDGANEGREAVGDGLLDLLRRGAERDDQLTHDGSDFRIVGLLSEKRNHDGVFPGSSSIGSESGIGDLEVSAAQEK